MQNGWIKLYRSMLDSDIMCRPKVLPVWIYILLSAARVSGHVGVRDSSVALEPGQVFLTVPELVKNISLSSRSVRTCLNFLVSTRRITCKTTNRGSLVTVSNWELYQVERNEKNTSLDTQNDWQATHKRQANKNKEDKKFNNTLSLHAGAHTQEAETISKVPVDMARAAIGYLNKVLGKNFNTTSDRVARGWVQQWQHRGYGEKDFRQVTDRMVGLWLEDKKMASNLRPSVLFGKNFEEYLNLPDPKPKEVKNVAYISRKGNERTKYPKGIAY